MAKYSQIRSSDSAGNQDRDGVVERPSGPADLLVVGHRRGRRAQVDAEGKVGLVVAHAQRRGRHQRLDLVASQPALEGLPVVALTRVRRDVQSLVDEECRASRSVSATVST